VLPSALPCGARTFLTRQRSAGRRGPLPRSPRLLYPKSPADGASAAPNAPLAGLLDAFAQRLPRRSFPADGLFRRSRRRCPHQCASPSYSPDEAVKADVSGGPARSTRPTFGPWAMGLASFPSPQASSRRPRWLGHPVSKNKAVALVPQALSGVDRWPCGGAARIGRPRATGPLACCHWRSQSQPTLEPRLARVTERSREEWHVGRGRWRQEPATAEEWR